MTCVNTSLPKYKQALEQIGNYAVLNKIVNQIGEEASLQEIMFTYHQMGGPYPTKTQRLVNEFLDRIKVDRRKVEKIVVNGVQFNANAIARTSESLIEYLEGNEDALTEEAMHFAVEILEQTNPDLFNRMMRDINGYTIFPETLDMYRTNPLYQERDGKPNIYKIKKEAIARKLADILIEQTNEETVAKNDLFKEWWLRVKAFFKELFKGPGFNPFQEAATIVMEGNIGSTADIIPKGYTRLYRGETSSPSDSPLPDWLRDSPEMKNRPKGSFFSATIEEAKYYDKKFGDGTGRITYVDIPTSDLEKYRASNNEGGQFSAPGLSEIEFFLPEELSNTRKSINEKSFLQTSNSKQDQIWDRIKATPDIKTADGYELDGKKIKRVSDITKEWYARKFKDNALSKSEYQTAVDDIKKEYGTAGHADMEAIFHSLIDDNGYVREQAEDDSKYVPQTNPAIYKLLKDSLIDRINSYPQGTRFMSEAVIYDNKNLAGTVDWLAIMPDGKVDILDWKFYDLNTDKFNDVQWYKKAAWRIQMANYKKIIQEAYQVPSDDFRYTQMIPIRANYSWDIEEDGNYYPTLSGVQIGNVDPKKEDLDYLLPVGLENQSSGDPKLDKLIRKLHGVRESLEDQSAFTPEERQRKAEQLNAMEKALRHLQVKQSVIPLIIQAATFTKELEALLDYYKANLADKNFSDLDNKTLSDFGAKLNRAFDEVHIYDNLDNELSYLFTGSLTEEQKEVWKRVGDTVSEARRLAANLNTINDAFGQKLYDSVHGQTVGDVNYKKITDPEVVIAFNKRLFNETSKLPQKTLQTFYQFRREAQNVMDIRTIQQNADLMALKDEYDKLAKSKGWTNKNYFDILQKDNKLIDQYETEFYKQVKEATKAGNYEWIKENIDTEAYKKKLQENYENAVKRVEEKIYGGTDTEIALQKRNALIELKKQYDLSTDTSLGWILHPLTLRGFPKEKWTTEEWKELHKPGNEAAVKVYNWIREVNEKADQAGYLPQDASKRTFLPYVVKSLMEKIVWGGKMSLGEGFINAITIDEDTVGYGQYDKITNRLVNKIPRYFINKPEDKELSTDLFRNLALYNESLNRYQQLSELEGIALALGRVERNKESLQTSFWGKPKWNSGKQAFETIDSNEVNSEVYDRQIASLVYGQKYVQNDQFDVLMGNAGAVFKRANEMLGTKFFPEDIGDRQLSLNKSIDAMNTFFQQKTLGLNPLPSLSNFLGGNFQALINAGRYFNKKEFMASEAALLSAAVSGEEGKKIIAAMRYFLPFNGELNKEMMGFKDLSLSKLSQESIQEFLFILMRKGDYMVQGAIFAANLKNQILINGKIQNARDYVRALPEFANKYDSPDTLKQVEVTFEKRVEEVIKEHGLLKQAKVEDGKLVIPGIEQESQDVFNVRNLTKELSKKALGNMSPEEVRGVQQNVYLRSMMVFKNWIPSLVDVRLGETKYNAATDAYEWGRMRTAFRFLLVNGLTSVGKLHDAVKGNKAGLEALNNLYEYKKKAYREATGQELAITQGQFYDLVRENIRQQAKDAIAAVGVLTLFLMASFLDTDDEDENVKNFHKFSIRALDKISDELLFFYNPLSFQQILNGSIFPSLGVMTDAANLMKHIGKELYGMGFDDEMQEKNYVIKYFLKNFPIISQLSSYMPLYAPDLAKDLGIRMSTQSRIR